MAALIHVARHATVQPEQYPVTVEDMDTAVGWGQAILTHALAVFDFMGADAQMEDARRILKWIQRRGQTEFSFRDCHHDNQTKYPKTALLEPAIHILVERQYIRLKPREKKSGRPSRLYEVNPLCKS